MSNTSESSFSKFFDSIKSRQPEAIERLRKWVEVESISCRADRREETIQMVHLVKKEFEESLGAKMKIVDNPEGNQMTPDGESIPYPPILLGEYPATPDANKKTILLYGHLDVQPALMSDGWDTEPFKLIEKDGKLYGRGSTDDKAPVLGWLLALESMKTLGIEIPVNLKFCFEGMEETGSIGLDKCVMETSNDFFQNIQGTCISDNYWLGLEKPCLTYGLRGISYWQLAVECSKCDLHSGVFGGTVHEAMTDLIQIMASLVDNRGNILIDGISEMVAPMTQEEEEIYKNIDFCPKTYADGIKGNLIHESKERTLQGRWRYPTLSLHGIEGAFYDKGEKTVIPRKVIGKFSLRLVPDMTVEQVHKAVTAHIEKQKKILNTPNKIYAENESCGKAWYGNPNGFLFEAGKIATKQVYGVEPDMTREGGSIPITSVFEDATKAPVILLPMGAADDGAHSQNEKINIRNYIEGTKLLGAFLLQLDGSL